jgi:hypothetical protein
MSNCSKNLKGKCFVSISLFIFISLAAMVQAWADEPAQAAPGTPGVSLQAGQNASEVQAGPAQNPVETAMPASGVKASEMIPPEAAPGPENPADTQGPGGSSAVGGASKDNTAGQAQETKQQTPQASDASASGTLQDAASTGAVQTSDISTEELINDLKARKIISDDEASWLIQKYRGQNMRFPSEGPMSREKFTKNLIDDLESQMKQDIQAHVKDDLKAQILKEARLGNWLAPTVPEWLTKIRLGGDIRVRYQGDYYGSDNADILSPSNPTQLMNTSVDRERMRLRVRFNTLIQAADQVDAGITISTGNTTNPVSINSTLGNYLNNTSIVLNRAWIRYKPMPELSIWAGRFQNPWFYTDLLWDDNLNFDGVALQFDTQLGRPLRTFLTMGAFPIQEVEQTSHDKWLYGAQTGIKLNTPEIISARIGVAYYYYTNIVGKANDPQNPGLNDWTAPQFQQMGNTLFDIDPSANFKLALASDYHELVYTASIDIELFDPIHVILTGDYVENIGFDTEEVAARTGNPEVEKDIKGYQVILGVGYKEVSDFGQWRFSAARKYIEADAVLDAFTDSNFHGGGTNAEGYILKGELGLTRNVLGSIQWYSSNEINGPTLGIDTLQVDMTVKF